MENLGKEVEVFYRKGYTTSIIFYTIAGLIYAMLLLNIDSVGRLLVMTFGTLFVLIATFEALGAEDGIYLHENGIKYRKLRKNKIILYEDIEGFYLYEQWGFDTANSYFISFRKKSYPMVLLNNTTEIRIKIEVPLQAMDNMIDKINTLKKENTN